MGFTLFKKKNKKGATTTSTIDEQLDELEKKLMSQDITAAYPQAFANNAQQQFYQVYKAAAQQLASSGRTTFKHTVGLGGTTGYMVPTHQTINIPLNYGPDIIDEQILSVQDERDSKDVQIEFRQLTCTCDYTTLIKLEYSTQDPSGDTVRIPCPACGKDLTTEIPNASPEGASCKIVETWKGSSKVKWSKKEDK